METLFIKLLRMSISASWVVLAVLLLRLVMRKVPKAIHCLLWAMVALRLLLPVTIQSELSMVPEPPEVYEEVVSPPISIPEGNYVFDQQSFVYEVDKDWQIQNPSQSIVIEPPSQKMNVIGIASIIWAVGMVGMLLYAFISFWRLRRKVSASILTQKQVYICDYIDTPFILGIFSPKIYLPSHMEPEAAAHVLAHEQAHLKRRDHWWKPLGYLLLAVYWFNPVLWLAYILLCRDIELACDEKVIREMDDSQKKAYSEALLNCSVPRRMIAACPLAFGEVGVKERVKSVLNYKKPGFWIVAIAVVMCVIAAVCFLTDPKEKEQTEPELGQKVTLDIQNLTAENVDYLVVYMPWNSTKISSYQHIDAILDFLKNIKLYPASIPLDFYETRNVNFSIDICSGDSRKQITVDTKYNEIWVADGENPLQFYKLKDTENAQEVFRRNLYCDGYEKPFANKYSVGETVYLANGEATPDILEKGRALEAGYDHFLRIQKGEIINNAWWEVGRFSPFQLAKDNFDDLLPSITDGWIDGTTAEELRQNNKAAWSVHGYIPNGDSLFTESDGREFYYLLLQKCGDIYLVKGRSNPSNGETEIFWVSELDDYHYDTRPYCIVTHWPILKYVDEVEIDDSLCVAGINDWGYSFVYYEGPDRVLTLDSVHSPTTVYAEYTILEDPFLRYGHRMLLVNDSRVVGIRNPEDSEFQRIDNHPALISLKQSPETVILLADGTEKRISPPVLEYDDSLVLDGENTGVSHYSIDTKDGNLYDCSIYDNMGNLLFSKKNLMKYPEISTITPNIYGVSLQAGTGLSTKWTVFCDVKSGMVSETFYSVLGAMGDRVVYATHLDGKAYIIVQNMFDKEVFYKEIYLKNASSVAADFIVDYELNEIANLSVTYLTSEDYKEKTIQINNVFDKYSTIEAPVWINSDTIIVDIIVDDDGKIIFTE